MRTTNIIKLSTLLLGTIVVGCGSSGTSSGPSGAGGNTSTSTTSTGGHTGTSTTATGGNTAAGGTSAGSVGGTSATASNTTAATGGNTSTTATGGTKAVGGASAAGGTTAAGGTKAVGGASAAGGTKAVGGATAAGGTTAATGGTSAGNVGGATGAGGTSAATVGGATSAGGDSAVTTGGSTGTTGCISDANVISDFEDTAGKGTLHKVGSIIDGKGYWYTFEDTTNCGDQTPASVTGGAVNSAVPTDTNYAGTTGHAMHSTVTGCSATAYSGFGAELNPDPNDTSGKKKKSVDLSTYDGVSFWIKGTSSSQIYVEFQTTDCIDAANGGTATSSNSDAFNCHGTLIKNVPTTWTKMYVPFGSTGVRWFPTSAAGGTTTCSNEFCEAPTLNRKDIVDVQFALEGPFNQKPATVAAYDVWVDDLALYKQADCGTTGLSTWTSSGNHPFPANTAFTKCSMPKFADGGAPDGNLLRDAYLNWKSKFVTGTGSSTRVVSPEIDPNTCNKTCSVSEGIAYGMLIAVYMGDKDLFDGLLGYWKSKASGQSMLMNWEISSGGSPTSNGSGSASDADEDAAFALQMARKQWGSAYDTDASTILSQFLANDVDSGNNVKPGNTGFGNASALFNPSYFAPAYYKYFATVDAGNATKWNALVTNGYAYIASISGSNGLVPAWCTSSCSSRGGGGYTDADMYQYDAHRAPFRMGLDACWNGDSNAKTYLDKVVTFFSGLAGAPGDKGKGLGSIGDIYNSGGTTNSDSANNSMSLIGCAGVGAMGSSATNAATFRDRAWAYLLEGEYTKSFMYTDGDSSTKPGFTYYNATVGLLTALAMSGNFYIMN